MVKLKSLLLIFLILTGLNILRAEEISDEQDDKILMRDIRITAMKDNTHILYTGDNAPSDSLSRLLNIFYYDQFRHFQDPRAPYFMFMSKKGDLALGVGGQVKIRGYFDWNGSIPNVGFIPYDIPIPKDPTRRNALAASPSGTGLFFTLLGNNKLLGNFMAYFQADFSGYNNRGFRIKKAYITVKNWTAGYAVTTFEDTQAEPATVDGSGPNGINSKKNVLVRYLHQFKKGWSLAGSVEFPSESVSADGTHTAACTPYIPDFAAFAQYQWGQGSSHVRLSGLLRTLTYSDLVRGRNHNITGWGLQFSTVINPFSPLNLFGIISTGQGHASYTTDLGNGDFDLIPDPDNEGRLYAPWAAGIVIGAQYYFNQKIFMNLAFSEQTYYPKHNPNDSYYKYGLYAVGNIFWDITPRFEVGLEYLHGKRMNFNGESGSANRLMALLMVSF
ncbi:MAG: hypothetical protein J1F12_00360 [Muribaculaceae bacterium]|nr:hypothetical protein [Muribaculaceae bacterium]